jgi:saccharopine dehydrogenase (NAD+, L-lysine-forming)
MATILILGGYGLTGRKLAHHLLREPNVTLVLGGRRLDRAQALSSDLAARFPGARVSAVQADAASAASLKSALDGVDVLLVAAPTTQHTGTVIRTALAAGVDYLDVQFAAPKLAALRALAPEITRAGRCFITEAGFHPGLPAAMVRWAAAQLDHVDSARVACHLTLDGELPWSEAVDELTEAFCDYQAQTFQNGAWTSPKAYDIRPVQFGPGIGERKCYSMFFEELRDLPAMFPTLRELGFYMAGSGWVVDWLITPLVFAGLKVAPRHGVRPLGRLLWWGMRTFAPPPPLTLLRIDATGERDGRPASVCATIAHEDAYELTAVPVVACLRQYLDGSAREPGLWMMGHLAEPLRLFRDMEQLGLRISTGGGRAV